MTDEQDFNIKYSYTNSRLKTYTVLDDRQDQTNEKGTDTQFLVNKSLQIRPHKALKVCRLIIGFLPALLELECLITPKIMGRLARTFERVGAAKN
jgi:hypothetical protein